MRVNDIAEFSDTLDSGGTTTLTVDTEERNATMVMLSVEDGDGGEAVYHGLEWEYRPTDAAGWRYYKGVDAHNDRTHVEPALPRQMRVTVTNVTDATTSFDIRLSSMGPQGNNAAGSMGMPPLTDGEASVADVSVLFSTLDLNSGVRTTEVKSEFNLTPAPLSVFRDWWPAQKDKVEGTTTEGSASYNGDTYVIETDASTTGRSFLETAGTGRYRAGSIGIAGIYVETDGPPVGFAEWGYLRETDTNALKFRYESDGSLSFVVTRDAVDLVIPQSTWAASGEQEVTDANDNPVGVVIGIDAMDGTGPSGVTLNPDHGYVYRVDFAWYGGGAIAPHIVEVGPAGRQRAWPLFVYMPRGQTSISQPNQPVSCVLNNDGTATADSIKVAGRQFSTAGDFEDETRETSHLREDFDIPTTWEPWLLVRRKDTIDGTATAEGISFDLGPLAWAVDQSIAFEARIGVVPDGSPDWQAPSRTSPDETAVEVAETLDGGNPLAVTDNGEKYGGNLAGAASGGNKTLTDQSREFGAPFPRRTVNAIFAKALDTATSGSSLNTTIPEGW